MRPKSIQYKGAVYRLVSAAKLPRLSARIRSAINDQIYDLVRGIRNDIPLSNISDVLRKSGLVLVDEDSTEWSGFLLGREGRVTIPLALAESVTSDGFYPDQVDHVLVLHWYKFPTGRYEVTAYVSL